MKNKLILTTVITALIFCLFACGRDSGKENAAERTTEAEQIETGSIETVHTDEWESATQIWVAGTELGFELRVKPYIEYEMIPDEDNIGCTFKADDGKEVHILIQGLDYENTFDQLISYFNTIFPESLSVGKESQNVIVKHSADKTELVSKLDGMTCLTTIAPDIESAEDFFSTVMIRVEGEDYSPFDPGESYDDILLTAEDNYK